MGKRMRTNLAEYYSKRRRSCMLLMYNRLWLIVFFANGVFRHCLYRIGKPKSQYKLEKAFFFILIFFCEFSRKFLIFFNG
jgi:hypothetical protein